MAAEDAAAQHEVTFRQWRENPAAFGIGDRYPVDEVFAEAKNAWQRAHPSTPVLTSIHVKVWVYMRKLLPARHTLSVAITASPSYSSRGCSVLAVMPDVGPALAACPQKGME